MWVSFGLGGWEPTTSDVDYKVEEKAGDVVYRQFVKALEYYATENDSTLTLKTSRNKKIDISVKNLSNCVSKKCCLKWLINGMMNMD